MLAGNWEASMSGIISQGELVRRAAAYVAEERKDHPEHPLHAVLDEAGMRFNLTPLDSQALERLFSHGPEDHS